MGDSMGKWGLAKRLGGAATAALMGGICSIVVSTGLLAQIELVPNGKDEKKPVDFCVYTVKSATGSNCTASGIVGGKDLCTQCPNDPIKKNCRPNSIAMQNVQLSGGNCTAILTTTASGCDDCAAGVQFYWLNKK